MPSARSHWREPRSNSQRLLALPARLGPGVVAALVLVVFVGVLAAGSSGAGTITWMAGLGRGTPLMDAALVAGLAVLGVVALRPRRR